MFYVHIIIEIIPPPLPITHTHTYIHTYTHLLGLLIKNLFLGLTCTISFTKIQALDSPTAIERLMLHIRIPSPDVSSHGEIMLPSHLV